MISAVPADTALTLPFSTVATLLLLLLHVTVLSVVFDGLIVALIVLLSPIVSVILEISSSILDGITVGSFTVHLQDAVKPFAVFAMISVVPADTALTFPLLTVATLLLLLLHVTVLSVAFDGLIVTVIVSLSPFTSDMPVLSS
jgi:hypothetical protein